MADRHLQHPRCGCPAHEGGGVSPADSLALALLETAQQLGGGMLDLCTYQQIAALTMAARVLCHRVAEQVEGPTGEELMSEVSDHVSRYFAAGLAQYDQTAASSERIN